MKLLNEKDIIEFINNYNYDIRKTKNARWIDQKCTPDVLSIVADCILDYVDNKGLDLYFTSQDIWHSEYTDSNVASIFQKPSVNSTKAIAEYNKFFMQPMELFAYSGVLERTKKGRCNYYKVRNYDILTYIAMREKNSLNFLVNYISKVVNDSDIFKWFENYFELQNKTSFDELKQSYTKFIIDNTPINGETEVHRIFTKVLNPLAHNKCLKGTERGRMSGDAITYDMLMYNRKNFRDLWSNKPKDVTRKDHLLKIGNRTATLEAIRQYLVKKAKRMVREYNKNYNFGMPECKQYENNEKGTHIHHIFSDEEFPEISYYYENLICLNPSQHLNHAHPDGNTHKIDRDFQLVLLMAKSDTIENDFKESRNFYDFNNFLTVLSIGLNNEEFYKIPVNDYVELNQTILSIYIGEN